MRGAQKPIFPRLQTVQMTLKYFVFEIERKVVLLIRVAWNHLPALRRHWRYTEIRFHLLTKILFRYGLSNELLSIDD